MRRWVLYVVGLVFGAVLGTKAWHCAYESGEEAARARYRESVRRIDDCIARGGDNSTCRSEHGLW